jgi:hypothetical protein
MSVEDRLQKLRVTLDWLNMDPFDSRKVEGLSQIADAEAHVDAANRALDRAEAAINRPATDAPWRGEIGIR